jgi:serine/arginine repetitive matrix protein 1
MSRALQTGADARALRDTKFPELFKQKVDITKVQLPVIKKWMADKIAKLQGFDDDFLPIMIEEMLIENRVSTHLTISPASVLQVPIGYKRDSNEHSRLSRPADRCFLSGVMEAMS